MARTHLALLRGINVVGTNKLPMADLRTLATDLGLGDVATHIQSGNLVFGSSSSSADLEARLGDAIETFLGKRIDLIVLTADEWRSAIASCPYQPAEDKLVHLQVHHAALPATAKAAIQQLVADADDGTEVSVEGRWVYVHTPQGFSNSVAFTKLGRLVPKGDQGTARNLNSAKAILTLLEK